MAAKTIMLQGTASGVGKSTLTAGICRLLHRQGRRVAPFKALNLSDNAHTLPDGRRMARSQAIAATACGIAPVAEMNPVLLLASGGSCETILCGEAAESGEVPASRLREISLAAYHTLAAQYDIIVAEGAGSPVELNLRDSDVANMGFATAVRCPVLLVSDIRRGGVYAAVAGTLALLHPAERALVKGVIVNGFYGNPAAFAAGAAQLAAVAGLPVLGVVPWLELHLEDEDSLACGQRQTRESIIGALPQGISFEQYQQQQLDMLADALSAHLDMELLLQILETGTETAQPVPPRGTL